MIKSYDTIARSGYIRFSRKPVARTREVTGSIFCDVDSAGQLVGIEMLDCIPGDLEMVTMKMDEQYAVV
jgi:uncharacterized protein YuzE